MNPDKHLKGYPTLKEARKAAVEYARAATTWHRIVPIYQESDGSFSVQNVTDGRSTFFVGIDKAGKRYRLIKKFNEQGVPYDGYEEIVKEE